MTRYEDMTVVQLKERLRNKGQSLSGNKAVLIARLRGSRSPSKKSSRRSPAKKSTRSRSPPRKLSRSPVKRGASASSGSSSSARRFKSDLETVRSRGGHWEADSEGGGRWVGGYWSDDSWGGRHWRNNSGSGSRKSS